MIIINKWIYTLKYLIIKYLEVKCTCIGDFSKLSQIDSQKYKTVTVNPF